MVLNEDIVRTLAPSASHIQAEMRRQLAEIERRRRIYLGNAAPIPAAGRTVILVDDGIATGGTVRAALIALRRTGPARLILAVPVAPPEAVTALAEECDEILCLSQPAPFQAVGVHYADFDQTGDEEVVSLLKAARDRPPQPPLDSR